LQGSPDKGFILTTEENDGGRLNTIIIPDVSPTRIEDEIAKLRVKGFNVLGIEFHNGALSIQVQQ
jgi:hypothetical protein